MKYLPISFLSINSVSNNIQDKATLYPYFIILNYK